VDNWEKGVNEFIEEIKRGGKKASKELDKQLTKLQDEGRAIARDLKGEDETVAEKMRDALDDLGDRLVEIQNKLTRAWDELKK
jgi:polyhydroxyalkanoate synthesis regulator phasin